MRSKSKGLAKQATGTEGHRALVGGKLLHATAAQKSISRILTVWGHFAPLRSRRVTCGFCIFLRQEGNAPKEVNGVLLSYIRTVILYLVLILVIRLMGKRQIGQMEPAEFVVTMLVANLASIPMQDSAVPLFCGLVPILTVLGLELVLAALSMKSILFRRLLCGKPVILIENGRILQENLRKTRINADELTGQLREKDVLDLHSVQFAILETNGQLSVFPYPKDRPATAAEAGVRAKAQQLPVTLISDGQLLEQNLPLARRSKAWVEETLRQKDATLDTTWLLTVDGGGTVYFAPKEVAK